MSSTNREARRSQPHRISKPVYSTASRARIDSLTARRTSLVFWLGWGVRELSMTPVRAAPVRQALRKTDGSPMRQLANQTVRGATPGEIRQLLADQRD